MPTKTPAAAPAAATTRKRTAPATKKAARQAISATPAASQSKPKLVRDSFTIPKTEYLVLESLKVRAASLARPVKKSELLRAGIKSLDAMSDKALLAALNGVPSLKTGRPKGVETSLVVAKAGK